MLRLDSDGNVARSESFTDLAGVLSGVCETLGNGRASLGGFVKTSQEGVDLLNSPASKPFGIGKFRSLVLTGQVVYRNSNCLCYTCSLTI